MDWRMRCRQAGVNRRTMGRRRRRFGWKEDAGGNDGDNWLLLLVIGLILLSAWLG
ncbi:MAG: hypothetical protein LBE84_02460 [Planctomycetota bacterium]|jgi:hypothetical protein|nr:hypothetical protein [Planctomycetota bacterium]